MGEARAGVRIAARRTHVGLGAAGGPPVVRVFLGLAHLHAAAPRFGFRAVAIAAARGGASQQGRRIGKKRKGASEQTNQGAEQSNGKPEAQKCSNAKSSHASFCARSLKKTDSAERLVVPLPGFWNLVRRCLGCRVGLPHGIALMVWNPEVGSDLNLSFGFGAPTDGGS